jgi:hypothetical protein
MRRFKLALVIVASAMLGTIGCDHNTRPPVPDPYPDVTTTVSDVESRLVKGMTADEAMKQLQGIGFNCDRIKSERILWCLKSVPHKAREQRFNEVWDLSIHLDANDRVESHTIDHRLTW